MAIAESSFTRVKNTANIHDEHADELKSGEPVFRVAACNHLADLAAIDTALAVAANSHVRKRTDQRVRWTQIVGVQ